MIDRKTLRLAAVLTLKAAHTSAGNSVYSPEDWPTQPGKYPILIVRTPREHKENSAPRSGLPQFFSTITLSVVGRVEAVTEAAAYSALETLSEQIETALLTNSQFINDNGVQQFASVDTTMDVQIEGERHYGSTVVLFGIEVFQMYAPTIDAAGKVMATPQADGSAGTIVAPEIEEMEIIIEDGNTKKTLTGIDIDLEGG